MAVIIYMLLATNSYLYQFNPSSSEDWFVVDDVVMGGQSSGNFTINEEGHGIFYGNVSTANNGGFSSIRMEVDQKKTGSNQSFVIRLKGDKKNYQFRVKPDDSFPHSYIYTFSTNGKWQEITIPFSELYPSFRGRRLDRLNFDSFDELEQMGFLIANKQNEAFKLEIDWIKLAP